MSDPNFDPYHEWLGIPPDEQPANHYRLLGLELFETDRGVIESVSLKQIAHVRTFAIGANSERSQLLLNELSVARVTLLNAVQKADYDQELRQQLNISPPPVEATSESTQQPVSASPPSASPRPEIAKSEEIERATSDPNSKQKIYISVGAGIALTLVILVFSIFYLRAQRVNQAVAQALSQGDYQAALELDPANEQALSMRRTAELVRFAFNRRDYREVLRLDPTNAQGLELKKASDLRRALADGDHARALLLDPGNPEAIGMRSSELKQALADGDYSRALEIDPTNPEALAMKDAAELRQALADGDYTRALEIDPNNAEALGLKKSAELRQALEKGDYARALEIDPNNAEALEMKKSADLRQALADGDYARALEIDPNNVDALAMKRANAPPPAIAPFDAAKAKEQQEAWAKYLGVEVEVENSIGMKLRVIPPGTFSMGEDYDAHEVTLTKPFILGTYEVTQDQFEKVMEVNPSNVKGATNPVEMGSWNDAVAFCRRLSGLPDEKDAGRVYHLPTEAQWEYACRAGTTTEFSFGDDESESGNYAWSRENSDGKTHPVGSKLANAFGLFDMHGNIWEWCQDWRGYYPSGAVTDPTGPTTGSSRVLRGGSWGGPVDYCRSAYRFRGNAGNPAFLGFRVCLSLSGKQLDASAALAPKGNAANTPPDASNTAPPPAIAPFDAAKAKEHQEAWAKYLDVEVETENSIGMKLRVIPPGTFTMGSDDDESRDHEKPLHQVLLTKPFVLGTTEVTQGQYEKVMGVNPSRFKSMDNPVGGVSWNDAVEFCARLSNLAPEKLAGRVYQLPTEAQWEYACRAGTTTKFGYGNNGLDLGTYAWYGNNPRGRSHPVGIKQPNGWGIHDMHGNAREWCSDPYGTYPIEVATDPTGSIESRFRVLRGGSFNSASLICRSAHRIPQEPDVKYSNDGLRVVCIVSPKNTFAGVAAASIGAGDAGSLMTSPNSSNNAPPPAIAPFDAAKAKEHQEAWAKYLDVEVETENSIGMKLSVIPAGTFIMGEAGVAHEVTLTKPFMLGTYEVTQGQYQRVMGTNPSKFKEANNPVETLSWDEAVEFCRRLSELPAEKAVGNIYHLPTEAEWEFACRAGTTTRYSFGDNESELGTYGWFSLNSGRKAHPVGGKQPNALGLFDIHGNVREWCQDRRGAYPSGAVTDPTGPTTGSARVFRGGSWGNAADRCRSAYCMGYLPSPGDFYLGFRVCLSPSGKQLDAGTDEADMAPKADDTSAPPDASNTTPPPANAPFDAAKAKEHQEAWAKYLGVEVETENSIGMKLSVIPPGTFTMGEDDDAHEVTLTEPFLLGTYEVTQGQYEKIVGEFGVSAGLEFDFNKPAHPLTWNQAALFCNKLSELQSEKTAGRVYELPTEAQWEYACRAGTITRYSFGNDVAKLSRYARVFTSPPYIPSAQRMQKVGQRLPNAWRLFDMHGNAYEWCRDTFASYPTQSALNPVNLSSSGIGIIRGGSAWFRSSNATSAYRKRWNREGARLTGNGFRVACRAKQVGEDSNPSATQMNTARPDSTDRMKSPPAATTNKPPPANAPFDAATAKEHQWAWAKDLGVEVETENSIGMKLRVIPPGTFMMGEYGGAHEVTLTKPFMLGTYEVTQAQYQKAMGTNPSTFKGANNPVEMVSWNDAVEFCRRLSELPAEKAAGRVYRLPTEAEWECACRAGTTTEYSFGNDDGRLNVYGWFNGNSGNTTHSVGGKRPNAWELYDMHGNVYEWCQDSYGPYPNRAVTDPTGAGTGLYRVYRGGRGNGPAWACRSWDRNRCPPADLSDYYGFRVCLSLSGS